MANTDDKKKPGTGRRKPTAAEQAEWKKHVAAKKMAKAINAEIGTPLAEKGTELRDLQNQYASLKQNTDASSLNREERVNKMYHDILDEGTVNFDAKSTKKIKRD